VTWHDGKPFTSADVKFSLEEIWKKLHPRGRVTFGKVTAVDTPDASTVVVRLSEPTPMMLAAFSSYESQVLPKHVYEGKDFTTHPALNAPIGTGPFVFKEWKKGDFIRLEKNPSYWDKGKPYLDAIVVRVVPDAAARAAAIEKGEVQLGVFNPVPLSDVKRLTALPTVKAETRGYEYFAPMYMMEVNLRLDHLKDKRVRQAMLHALDRKFVADNLWFGFAKPATGPIASSSPFYTTQGVPQYPYDVARANAILDEAGYKRGAGNMRFKVALTFPPVQPEIPRTAEYIKQALARVGIDVELRNIDLATFIRPGLQLGVRADPELPLPAARPDARRPAALHQQATSRRARRSPTRPATRTRTWTPPSRPHRPRTTWPSGRSCSLGPAPDPGRPARVQPVRAVVRHALQQQAGEPHHGRGRTLRELPRHRTCQP
jgi:peptide/nickel transport system substrate-binding protein